MTPTLFRRFLTRPLFLNRLIVPIFVVMVFAGIHYRSPMVADDIASVATVGALVDHGTLAISSLQGLDQQVGIGAKGPDGQLYSKYGLGQVILGAPLYALGRLIPSAPYDVEGIPIAESQTGVEFLLYLNPLMMGVLAWLMQLLVKEMWGDSGNMATVVVAFTTPLFITARTFGTELNTAVFLVLALLACLRRQYALGLLCVGIAALFRPAALVFATGWVILLIHRPRREWLLNGIALMIGILGVGLANYIRFGSFLESGYASSIGFTFQFDGLLGFLISPGRSIILFAPWVLLTLPLFIHSIKTRNHLILGLFLGMAVFIILHSTWREWHGGWSYGPRLLMPIVPILAILVVPWVSRWYALPLLLIGLVIELITIPIYPPNVFGAAIVSGLSLEQTIWSLDNNILVLQVRSLLTPGREVSFVIVVFGCLALILGQILMSKRRHLAQTH